jgi:Phage tail protein
VLTEVKAYSSWQAAPELLLDDLGRPETDLVQIRNIDGLNPVEASVNTSPLGSVDGVSYVGSNVPSRNIVLTVHPNPDWDNWTYENLRRLLYLYFMPKRTIRLVFYSDDMPTVEISGIVESVEVNPFSTDPELIVSIICPDPYFTALAGEITTGQSVRPGGTVRTIDYNGTIEAGIHVKVEFASGSAPTVIGIQIGDPKISYFTVAATVSASKYFEMSSLPMRKFVQNIDLNTGVITNLLSKIQIREGSAWPILQPGESHFSVITDTGVQDWELTYFERFGGL